MSAARLPRMVHASAVVGASLQFGSSGGACRASAVVVAAARAGPVLPTCTPIRVPRIAWSTCRSSASESCKQASAPTLRPGARRPMSLGCSWRRYGAVGRVLLRVVAARFTASGGLELRLEMRMREARTGDAAGGPAPRNFLLTVLTVTASAVSTVAAVLLS